MQNTIASRIRSRLDALGKSAAATSIEAGLGRSALQDILSGRVGNPRYDTLTKIAEVLECSIGYLTGINEEPTDGADWASFNEYTLFDATPERIYERLAAGVFRTEEADENGPVDEALHIAYRDINHPQFPVRLYEQADQSMSAIGILKGDIVTATDLNSQEIALIPGKMVVVKRVIGMEGPLEMSLRIVDRIDGQIVLATRPLSAQSKPIIIASRRAQDGEELYNPNFYWTSPDDSGWVHIEAVALRVTRQFDFID